MYATRSAVAKGRGVRQAAASLSPAKVPKRSRRQDPPALRVSKEGPAERERVRHGG